jgi:signal peptidase complex subunit 3
VLLAILALVSSTTFLIPNKLNAESSSLKINGLNVVKGVNQYERSAKAREYAFVKFDLRTGQFALSGLQEESSGRKAKLTTVLSDLRPLFNWNTKQVFVSLVADYSTPSYVSSASLGVSSLRRNILER